MKLSILGDIMCTEEQLHSYISNTGESNFDKAVSGVKGIDSQYIIANLETPIADENFENTKGKYSFSSPQALAEALKSAGISMVTTANNHCLDRGEEGLKQTMLNLQKVGLDYVGTHLKEEESYKIVTIEGIKVGILAYTYGTNAFANNCYLEKCNKYMVDMLQCQELSNPLLRKIYNTNNFALKVFRKVCTVFHIAQFNKPVYEREGKCKKELSKYIQNIKECKMEGAEFIIACLHIGGQYNENPTKYTKKLCRLSLNKWGVDAVIANHEHVIHPIELQKTKENQFCIYSLGNFLSATGVIREPFDKMAEYSAGVHIYLTKDQNKVVPRYAIELFVSVEEDGIIVSRSVLEYIEACTDKRHKEKLMEDTNVLLNRLFQTKQKRYPLQKEYFL